MTAGTHHYQAQVSWTGATQGPTRDYESYSREYTVAVQGKPAERCSADPHFRGDPALPNPEDMLLSAVAGCHMLTYLALCSRSGVEVLDYEDRATATMGPDGGVIRFTEAVLHPKVTVAPGTDLAKARRLHDSAHRHCFITQSVSFPVRHEAEIVEAKAVA